MRSKRIAHTILLLQFFGLDLFYLLEDCLGNPGRILQMHIIRTKPCNIRAQDRGQEAKKRFGFKHMISSRIYFVQISIALNAPEGSFNNVSVTVAWDRFSNSHLPVGHAPEVSACIPQGIQIIIIGFGFRDHILIIDCQIKPLAECIADISFFVPLSQQYLCLVLQCILFCLYLR